MRNNEKIQVSTVEHIYPHEFYKSNFMTETKIIIASNIQDNDIKKRE